MFQRISNFFSVVGNKISFRGKKFFMVVDRDEIVDPNKKYEIYQGKDIFHSFYSHDASFIREIILPLDDPKFDIREITDYGTHEVNKISFGRIYALDDVSTLKYLVKLGASAGRLFDYVLNWACEKNYFEVVKYLVEIGANVNEVSYSNDNIVKTPLTFAIGSNNLEMVKFLVEKGAKIRVKKKYPIKYACRINAINIINYFDSLNVDNRIIFDWACQYGNIDLIKKKIINGIQCDGSSIIIAASHGQLETIKYLHHLGGDINYIDDLPLSKAAESGHLDVVEYLVNNGANIRAFNDNAMIHAVRGGKINVIRYFSERISYSKNDYDRFISQPSIVNNNFPDLMRQLIWLSDRSEKY